MASIPARFRQRTVSLNPRLKKPRISKSSPVRARVRKRLGLSRRG